MQQSTGKGIVIEGRHPFFEAFDEQEMSEEWVNIDEGLVLLTGHMVEALYYTFLSDFMSDERVYMAQLDKMGKPCRQLAERGAIELSQGNPPTLTPHGDALVAMLESDGMLPDDGMSKARRDL